MSTRLRVGEHTVVDLIVGRGKEWRGIGGVQVDGVGLRDATWPITVRVDTPEGILYTRFLIDDIAPKQKGAVDVRLRAVGLPWGRQEYMDEYQQPMVTPDLSPEPVEDLLTLTLAPASAKIGGVGWQGFSHAFRFKSARRRVHRLLVNGTWELGGSIAGNTLLSQGQCNMPVYTGARGSLFTTACLKTLDQYGSPQGVSYQLGPRAGLIQGFDFQCGKAGALLQYWPRLASISSLLESPAGSTRLHVVDEHRGTASRAFGTVPQVVLFSPGELAEHEARDLWWECHRHVYGGVRKRYGISESLVRPELGVEQYGTRLAGKRLRVSIMGKEVDSTRMLHLTADRLLPRLAQQGIRRMFPIDAHVSDVTELGMVRKLDSGIHGEITCSSVCASHRYFPSDFWGGIKGWRYLADRARELGIEIGCWISPHFSPRAEIFREHPDWLLRGPDSLNWGGGYHNIIVTADWNTGVFDWVLDDVKRWVDEGGLDYMFIDSWANMGLLQSSYAKGMETNWEPLCRLLAEIRKLGVKRYSFEGISPLGISRFGCTDRRGDLLDATQGVVGQNDYAWWHGNEDMAFNLCFHLHPRKRDEEDVFGIQFRMMANRGYCMLPTTPDYELPRRCVALHGIYEQALPDMVSRRLLPNGAGVRWLSGKRETIWAFSDVTMPVDMHARVECLTAEGAQPVTHAGVLEARAWRVYRLRRG